MYIECSIHRIYAYAYKTGTQEPSQLRNHRRETFIYTQKTGLPCHNALLTILKRYYGRYLKSDTKKLNWNRFCMTLSRVTTRRICRSTFPRRPLGTSLDVGHIMSLYKVQRRMNSSDARQRLPMSIEMHVVPKMSPNWDAVLFDTSAFISLGALGF